MGSGSASRSLICWASRSAWGRRSPMAMMTLRSPRRSRTSDAVHVLEEAVQDAVGDGRLAESFVPHGDGQLAGDDGGAQLHVVFYDLEHVGGLVGCERADEKIVDDQDVQARPCGEQTG